jgi:hypothetical protein
LRFTTVQGGEEMAEPGVQPIDVCIRDGKTGEVLIPPRVFGDSPMIEGCAKTDLASEAGRARSGQLLRALDALTTVRFQEPYRPEYVALVNQSMRITRESATPAPFGGGVILHGKTPELPAGATEPGEPGQGKDGQ